MSRIEVELVQVILKEETPAVWEGYCNIFYFRRSSTLIQMHRKRLWRSSWGLKSLSYWLRCRTLKTHFGHPLSRRFGRSLLIQKSQTANLAWDPGRPPGYISQELARPPWTTSRSCGWWRNQSLFSIRLLYPHNRRWRQLTEDNEDKTSNP